MGSSGAERLVAGRYRLVEPIGQGGMAEVYRATDETLGREVALKIFRAGNGSAEHLARQHGEVRLLARLSHPCLVTLFDSTSDADGRVVLVLEFVAGTDARRRLQDGPIDPAGVAAAGADLSRALAYIHSQGVIHRDVKPANILLPASSHAVTAKLTDLGIARLVDASKLTATGSVIGTASYMSPEQAVGRPLNSATDVYSLGLVLLELLTGHCEFPGTAVEAASARLARDPVIPARLGPAWSELLQRMTARDPAGRPTADEVSARLAQISADATSISPGARSEAPDGTRTVAMTEPLGPQTAAATKVLPAAAAPPLPPKPPIPAQTLLDQQAQPRTRKRSRTVAVVIGVGLAAATAIVIALVAIPGSTQRVPDPVGSYPAVSGQLGEHLQQLEHQVSTTTSP
ncbi:hypothetical protein LK09_17600 [Microbacterium mangrovi]|uniref:non-specific serine/threonine protein kinase n=2 Tax=Microbacterium mangrovi TaxID=1348253 RepID=A0A0B2A241_9MICO|nr:hypothetical protein LK09_17600 [Microbacterium mangrovi]